MKDAERLKNITLELTLIVEDLKRMVERLE